MNINEVIGSNVSKQLKLQHQRQSDLGEFMGLSRQIISKMLNGTRTISAVELKSIAEFCSVPMKSLITVPVKNTEMNVIHAFMGQVQTDEAKRGIELADELIELYVFHNRVNESTKRQMIEWSDL